MTEECAREMFTPVAVCPRCNRKLTVYELHSTYKQNWLLRHELFRRLVYECKYCRCELAEQDFIKKSVNIKGVGNMDIKNLTETEQQDFYRLLEKMNGEELDKEQDVKIKKPQINECYYIIDNDGKITTCVWLDNNFDRRRWELGNVFFTEEEAEFAREKKKVEVELERYAEEHNNEKNNRIDNCHIVMNTGTKEADVSSYWVLQVAGATCFSNRDIAKDAIEAVGKDRILKYIFCVESEGE